jgi:hypothetical protein
MDVLCGAAMIESVLARSVQLSPARILTAMADGRSWMIEFNKQHFIPLPISPVAAARSSPAASLIEAAISAGLTQTGHIPVEKPRTSLPRYIRWLVGNCIFASQTPGIVRRAADRFEELGRSDLAEFSRQKAAEEDGHAELAYRDLQALGLPAIETIRAVQWPSATVFVDRLRNYAESSTPITLFGFSYCLERMAVGRDRDFIRAVEAVCPPDCRAFRFLKVHSNVGSDQAHVDEQLTFFEALTDSDFAPIVCAAYETAALLARQATMDEALTDDDEMDRRLAEVGIHLPLLSTHRPDPN